jgi:hypothetical protein
MWEEVFSSAVAGRADCLDAGSAVFRSVILYRLSWWLFSAKIAHHKGHEGSRRKTFKREDFVIPSALGLPSLISKVRCFVSV